MKRFLFLLFILPASLNAGSFRNISGSYDASDTAALNLNFLDVTNEFYDAVHKTSTETIRGFKYFLNSIVPVTGSSINLGASGTTFLNAYIDSIVTSTITITSATITNLTVTTATITNLSTGTFNIGGITFGLMPIGAVLPYASTTVIPAGWLLCDGTSYSTTTYSKLFTVISYVFGGSGANFNVPNTNGLFLKSARSQTISGVTYSGTNGTSGGDTFQGHFHNRRNPIANEYIDTDGSGTFPTLGVGNAAGLTMTQVAEAATDGTNGTPRTGSVTQPAFLGINYIIYAAR